MQVSIRYSTRTHTLFPHPTLVRSLRNSAHDSICACSVDEVCDAVLHRFAEAIQIAQGLANRAVQALGATIGVDGHTPVVVNPSQRTRGGVVELSLPGTDVPDGCQDWQSTRLNSSH